MRGAARAGDNDANTAIGRVAGEIGRRVRSAMRGEDMRFVGDAKLIKRFDAMAHRFPI